MATEFGQNDLEASFDPGALQFIVENWQAVANLAFRNMAENVVQTAKLNIDPSRSGLHVISGKLQESIKMSNYVQLSPDAAGSATITAGNANVPYAAIQEYGGEIHAKNKMYLTFKVGDKWIRTKSVTLPARPYLQTAVDEEEAKWQQYIEVALLEVLKQSE